ncbi:hypothetical protein AAE478_005041 [Parahypoxylon ruwenzoriense]
MHPDQHAKSTVDRRQRVLESETSLVELEHTQNFSSPLRKAVRANRDLSYVRHGSDIGDRVAQADDEQRDVNQRRSPGQAHESSGRANRQKPSRRKRNLTRRRLCRTDCTYPDSPIDPVHLGLGIGLRSLQATSRDDVSNSVILDRINHVVNVLEGLRDSNNNSNFPPVSTLLALQHEDAAQSDSPERYKAADYNAQSAFTDDGFSQLEVPETAARASSCESILQWPILRHLDLEEQITCRVWTGMRWSWMSSAEANGEAFFSAAQRRLGLLPNSLIAIQCAYFAGLYEKFAVRPLDTWQRLQGACERFQALLYAKALSSNTADREEQRARHIEQCLYWSCVKAGCELRAELQLPASGLLQFKYPGLFPALSFPPELQNSSPAVQTERELYAGLMDRSHTSNPEKYSILEEERSWLYYLAEISLRGIMNRLLADYYGEGETAWINDISSLRKRYKDYHMEINLW